MKNYDLIPLIKNQHIQTAIRLCLTILGIPFAGIFFYIAKTSKITLTEESLIFKLLFTRTVPLREISGLTFLSPLHTSPIRVNGEYVKIAVVPLEIKYRNKKLLVVVDQFEKWEEILRTLEKNTGLTIQNVPEHLKAYSEEKKV